MIMGFIDFYFIGKRDRYCFGYFIVCLYLYIILISFEFYKFKKFLFIDMLLFLLGFFQMDFEYYKLEQCLDLSGFNEKGRVFSISISVVYSKFSDDFFFRFLSISVWFFNDSGYGDFFCSSSVGDDICQVILIVSRGSFISFRLIGLDLSSSFISIVKISGLLQIDKYVFRFFFGVYILDFEIFEEE